MLLSLLDLSYWIVCFSSLSDILFALAFMSLACILFLFLFLAGANKHPGRWIPSFSAMNLVQLDMQHRLACTQSSNHLRLKEEWSQLTRLTCQHVPSFGFSHFLFESFVALDSVASHSELSFEKSECVLWVQVQERKSRSASADWLAAGPPDVLQPSIPMSVSAESSEVCTFWKATQPPAAD